MNRTILRLTLALVLLMPLAVLHSRVMREPVDREAAALERFNAILDWKEAMRVSDKGKVEKMPRQPEGFPSDPDSLGNEVR